MNNFVVLPHSAPLHFVAAVFSCVRGRSECDYSRLCIDMLKSVVGDASRKRQVGKKNTLLPFVVLVKK